MIRRSNAVPGRVPRLQVEIDHRSRYFLLGATIVFTEMATAARASS